MNYNIVEQKLMNRYGEEQYEACVKMLYKEGWSWAEIKEACRARLNC